ncbi:Dynamin central region-domain-containing protein [Lactarius quietus]|nr:Dynamin central region-domain-containing protein [Lactarius quietus]
MATGFGAEIVSTINKLQDRRQIDLPQICVLGSQSSGKSSVLENIVGRDFLPRGSGIVTRRPLVLQLIHRPATTAAPTVNGNGGPVGDQPKDIEKQIRDMLFKYISKPACIILAVTPANTDLANSDGLKMAREVDPEGTRTIGVLTKGFRYDVVDILAGRVIPLRLGYVPVVNRGQRDIDTTPLLREPSRLPRQGAILRHPFLARKLNMGYLDLDAPHPRNASGHQSTHHLQLQKYTAELLSLGGPLGDGNSSSIVLSIITEFTNEFRTVLDGNTNDLSLNELSGGARISFVFHELFNVGVKSLDPFDQVKDGDIRVILYNSSGSTPALFVGTAAFEVIVKQQIKRLEEPSLKCCQLVYDELIRILGQLLSKIQAFRRYPALRERFNSVVVNFFKTAMTPTTKLVSDMVAMQACYVNTTHPDFLNGHKAMALVTDRLNANKPATPEPKAGKVTSAQLNNNKDLDVDMKKEEPSFFGSFFSSSKSQQQKAKKGPQPMETALIRPQAALNDRETLETEVIKLLIHSYFNIVKREMIDMVPKAISLTLVNHSKENLQRELLQELYKPEVLEDLLKESELVVTRRKEVVGMVQALNKAEEIVAGV